VRRTGIKGAARTSTASWVGVICATSSSRFQACLAAPRPGEIASERTRLTTALRGGRTLKYIYDFGDQREHQIKLEKAWAPDSQIRFHGA
jgi:hypothetical protein